MLMPKRVKHRKVQRGRMRGKATRGNFIAYGDFGLQATECGWITSNQIESARIAINRYVKRGGKLWIKIFPDKPVTEKPAETRMGSGKGSLEYWVAVVKPGRVLFEIAGVTEEAAREAMRLASHKLPVKTKFVSRKDFEEMGGEVMKANELKELRQSNPQDLQVKMSDLKAELFNFRFQLATGQLENPMRIKEVKKSIAQIKTILREEEIKAFEQ